MSPRSVRVILACVLSVFSVSVFAQNNRSFVATTGNDANNCTPGNECRSFTRALAVTNSGGEVLAINSGGFGPFTVTTAVTVAAAPGVRASITTAVSDGIDVYAGASDRVVLSGLTIFINGPYHGIVASAFKGLAIENCTIEGGNFGIEVYGPVGSFATLTDVVVRDSVATGVWVTSHASMVRCRIDSTGSVGLLVDTGGGVDGVVSAVDLVSVNNQHGVASQCVTDGHTVVLDLDRALIMGNSGNGVFGYCSTGAAIARLSNSVVTQNGGYGLDQYGISQIQSLGNNMVAGNAGGDVYGTITPLPAK